MMREKKKRTPELISQKTAIEQYGVTKKIIEQYFPKPVVRYTRNHRYLRLWPRQAVEEAVSQPEVLKLIGEAAALRRRDRELSEARELLLAYTPEHFVEKAKTLRRVFVLHVGPTNSGKTHDALEALRSAGNGVYLGPLRLLALEMFDRLNALGAPCSLLTGEESIPTEGAEIVASTVELCNFRMHYRAAVIDEAQLITDDERGASWLKAICCVDADEVHICLAPEALGIVESLVAQFGDPYTVVRHERLVPLEYRGKCGGFEELQPYDAVICFSRKNVLSTAAHLERFGYRASVIYGALPPVARRSEVEKYVSGETNMIVATDAIGMGISLPIRRVIFAETQKFDGKQQRPLTGGEVRQIAGRAGRFGMFPLGEVLTMEDDDVIETGLTAPVMRIRTPCIEFPREVLDTAYELDVLLKAWQNLPGNRSFKREDMSSALSLYGLLRDQINGKDRELVFSLITCPIDTDNRDLVLYWLSCARCILRGKRIPDPPFDIDTLLGCEQQYKAWDINHQLKMRIGIQDDNFGQREEICRRIQELMAADKNEYIRRCRECGCELPPAYPYNLCERCFERRPFPGHLNQRK